MKDMRRERAAVRWTIQRTRTLALLAATTLVVGIAACGGESPAAPTTPTTPTTPATTPVGSYDISTVNAKSLPVALASDTGGFTWEVTSGSLTLTADGKYSAKLNYRQTLAGKVDLFVDSTGGTWTLSGTTVTFLEVSTGLMSAADWANSTGKLTFIESEVGATNTYVYTIKK